MAVRKHDPRKQPTVNPDLSIPGDSTTSIPSVNKERKVARRDRLDKSLIFDPGIHCRFDSRSR